MKVSLLSQLTFSLISISPPQMKSEKRERIFIKIYTSKAARVIPSRQMHCELLSAFIFRENMQIEKWLTKVRLFRIHALYKGARR